MPRNVFICACRVTRSFVHATKRVHLCTPRDAFLFACRATAFICACRATRSFFIVFVARAKCIICFSLFFASWCDNRVGQSGGTMGGTMGGTIGWDNRVRQSGGTIAAVRRRWGRGAWARCRTFAESVARAHGHARCGPGARDRPVTRR